MKYLLPLLLAFAGPVFAAETSLLCEYGEKDETRLLRFDEAAGTLRYKGEILVDRSKHNEKTPDGWTLPISVTFSPTEIKAVFHACTGYNGFGYEGCRTERAYTLDRTTGTFTAEPVKKFLVRLNTAIIQCRLADSAPKF